MTGERDELFKSTPFGPSEFKFDEGVARVFTDMLRRSIPGYGTLLQLIGVIAKRFVQDGTHVYDLGASLGGATLAVRHAVGSRDVTIVAIDNSAAMVERCRSHIEDDPAPATVEVVLGDITKIALLPSSLVILNFTLQFVPEAERDALIRRIFTALRPGGALLISEKLKPSQQAETLFSELHDSFRETNGYSQLELARKRSALENVLIAETAESHIHRLQGAGFQVTTVFSALHFSSFLALRPC